jgi:hypothetical protein
MPLPMSTQLTVHMLACIDARALMRVWSRTFPAPVLLSTHLRDWSPRAIIPSLRHVPSQVGPILLLYHNVNKFVRIVSNLVPSQVPSTNVRHTQEMRVPQRTHVMVPFIIINNPF